MSKWPKYRIKDVCSVTSSTRIRSSEYQDDGIPFYRGKEIIEKQRGALKVSTDIYIPRDRFEEVKRKGGVPKGGELLLTSVGTLGVPYVVREGEEFYFKDGNLTWFRELQGLQGKYLYYWLLSPLGKAELKKCVIGSSQPAYTIVLLKEMEIDCPPLQIQHQITEILSAYDDLIENNMRRIEILEEMARRLYEEWFVQFRFPGNEGVVFEDDVPQGWSRVRLDSVAEVNPEAISPKNAPDEIMYVDISSVSTRQVNKLQRLEFSEAPGRARRKVISGDVVWSCVRPALRSYALIIDPPPNTIVSTGFAVVRADSVPFSYLYQVLGSDQFVSYLDNHATGAAYPAVKASDFEVAEVVLPCKNLLAQFDGAVLPMLKMIHVLRLKNNNLQSQRDLLLPKLISGEIDVSDIPMPT